MGREREAVTRPGRDGGERYPLFKNGGTFLYHPPKDFTRGYRKPTPHLDEEGLLFLSQLCYSDALLYYLPESISAARGIDVVIYSPGTKGS